MIEGALYQAYSEVHFFFFFTPRWINTSRCPERHNIILQSERVHLCNTMQCEANKNELHYANSTENIRWITGCKLSAKGLIRPKMKIMSLLRHPPNQWNSGIQMVDF